MTGRVIIKHFSASKATEKRQYKKWHTCACTLLRKEPLLYKLLFAAIKKEIKRRRRRKASSVRVWSARSENSKKKFQTSGTSPRFFSG